MKSTELHVTRVMLGAIHWGTFDLRLEGTNTKGAYCGVTVRIEWKLWPLIAGYAALAWLKEKQARTSEMMLIEATLPEAQPQAEERRAA